MDWWVNKKLVLDINQIGKQLQSISLDKRKYLSKIDEDGFEVYWSRHLFRFVLDDEVYEFDWLNPDSEYNDHYICNMYLGTSTNYVTSYDELFDYSSIVGEYISHFYIHEYHDQIVGGHILEVTFYNEEDKLLMKFEFTCYAYYPKVELIVKHHTKNNSDSDSNSNSNTETKEIFNSIITLATVPRSNIFWPE